MYLMTGPIKGLLIVKVWNRTTEEIKNLRITFSEDFHGRYIFFKRIKPNNFKSKGIWVLDMKKNNSLVLELDNFNKVVLLENVTEDTMGCVVVNINGINSDGTLLYTSELEKE